MVKRILLFAWVIVMLSLLIFSFSEKKMARIAKAKYATTSWWGSDKYRYGDLYGLSYLPDFKFSDRFTVPAAMPVKYITPNYHLYLLGDSYLTHGFVIQKEQFPGASIMQIESIYQKVPLNWKPDISSFNILVLEITERNLNLFKQKGAFKNLLLPVTENSTTKTYNSPSSSNSKSLGGHWLSLTQYRFNQMLEANLGFNIFDYRIFALFKTAKAWFDHKVFHKISKEVRFSPDCRYLLFNSTLDPLEPTSAFRPVSDAELDSMVAGCNNLASGLKKMGFDQVIFSAVPNPVSVLYPEMGHYNHLAERVMNNPALGYSTVNMYQIFRNEKNQVYQRNDSHWNQYGFSLWLNELNKTVFQLRGEGVNESND
jgi:hypothetical protein